MLKKQFLLASLCLNALVASSSYAQEQLQVQQKAFINKIENIHLAQAKGESTNIWNDFDVDDPNLQVKNSPAQDEEPTIKQQVQQRAQQKSRRAPNNLNQAADTSEIQKNIQNSGQPKPTDPFKLLEELQDPNAPQPKNSLLSGEDDPAGGNLEKKLPLDQPLTERFAQDILDPIELDVNEQDVLDLNIQKALLISLESNLPQRIIDETVIRDKWRFWTTSSGLLPDGFYSYSMNDQSLSGGVSSAGTSLSAGTTHTTSLGA
ncbi:MAG: hypothetical protein SFU25_11405, partial [Candidatus Caenarcaniphilales bacterium]|nr:hypothetical protein [Candidatus Caenarcaniphilales bacterium]